MAKIQQLSAHVADLIAAGEVVERPASAAKELVENAIDAGATKITVELQNGGMTFLRVTDDGCGMSPEDARTAFLRHATSKLRTERDLEAIHTLGFRGEALAAICAVSQVDLLTKTADAPLGTSLHLEAGVITDQDDAGCPDGTTIIVRDLFYNTPARMKFMKRDSVEASAVISAVAKLALAHPEIAIRVIKDGKEELQTPGDGQLLSAIRSVLGKQSVQEMVELKSHFEKYTLTGYVSKPTATRGNRTNQIFFVNGRLVRSKTMCAALEEAYVNRMMSGRYPYCVLHLRLPEHLVDVNVHPAKIEVKFTNDREIFDCVRYGVQGALDKAPARVPMQLPKQQTASVHSSTLREPQAFKTMTAKEFQAYSQLLQPVGQTPAENSFRADSAVRPCKGASESGNFKKPVGTIERNDPEVLQIRPNKAVSALPELVDMEQSHTVKRKEPPAGREKGPCAEVVATTENAEAAPMPTEEQQTFDLPTKPYRVVGEIMDTYIIVEQGRSMLLIDKHAAHERLLFEKYRKQTEPIMPQLLLVPLLCSFEREQAAILMENEELLSQFGFSLSDYGEGTLAVRQIPSELSPDHAGDTLGAIAADLKNGKQPETLRDTLLHTIACKAAVKGGQNSKPIEREAIVHEVLTREDLKYCPHGRPICVELTDKQLEKQFKR